jgi:transposase InsO family protein
LPLCAAATIPQITRSALHRCFQRHGISRLPDLDGRRPAKKKFKVYPIGYFHVDLTEVRTAEGKLYLFVAIDRTSKFAFTRLVERATRREAADFLQELIETIPYKIHTVLTDNGTHFTTPGNVRFAAADIKLAWQRGEHFRAHSFEVACARHDIDHRLTKPNHPWTNGQVERMNRTIKEATVRTYHYDGHAQLREHLSAFLNAYNFAKRLKTLAGLTSYQFICSCWQKEPERFKINPHRLSSGLNTAEPSPL